MDNRPKGILRKGGEKATRKRRVSWGDDTGQPLSGGAPPIYAQREDAVAGAGKRPAPIPFRPTFIRRPAPAVAAPARAQSPLQRQPIGPVQESTASGREPGAPDRKPPRFSRRQLAVPVTKLSPPMPTRRSSTYARGTVSAAEKFYLAQAEDKLGGGTDSYFLAHYLADPQTAAQADKWHYLNNEDIHALAICNRVFWHTSNQGENELSADMTQAEVGIVLRAAYQAMAERTGTQLEHLEQASGVALCSAAALPIAARVSAYERMIHIRETISDCLALAALAVPSASEDALVRWWADLWRDRLLPIAVASVGMRRDRAADTGDMVRASWLPGSGAGPDFIGRPDEFASRVQDTLVDDAARGLLDPLALLYQLAYGQPRDACQPGLLTIMLAAWRAGVLAPRLSDDLDAEYADWSLSVGEDNDEPAGVLTGATLSEQQALFFTSIHASDDSTYGTPTAPGCALSWKSVDRLDEDILGAFASSAVGGAKPAGEPVRDRVLFIGTAPQLVRSFAAMAVLLIGRNFIDLSGGKLDTYGRRWASRAPQFRREVTRRTDDSVLRDIVDSASRLLARQNTWFEEEDAQSLAVWACATFLQGRGAGGGQPDANVIRGYAAAARALVAQRTSTALIQLVALMCTFIYDDAHTAVVELAPDAQPSAAYVEAWEALDEHGRDLFDALRAPHVSTTRKEANDHRVATELLAQALDMVRQVGGP